MFLQFGMGILSIGAGLLSKAADKLFSGEARDERKQVREAKKKVKAAARTVKQTGKVEVKETEVVKANLQNTMENIKQFIIMRWYIFAGAGALILFIILKRRGVFGGRSGTVRRRSYAKKKNSPIRSRAPRSGKRLTGHAFYLKMQAAKRAKARK
jgi:hypothetical protein